MLVGLGVTTPWLGVNGTARYPQTSVMGSLCRAYKRSLGRGGGGSENTCSAKSVWPLQRARIEANPFAGRWAGGLNLQWRPRCVLQPSRWRAVSFYEQKTEAKCLPGCEQANPRVSRGSNRERHAGRVMLRTDAGLYDRALSCAGSMGTLTSGDG